MKIVFYFGVFARIGGIEEFTKDLALELLGEGMEVELVCAALHHPVLDELRRAGAAIRRVPVYHGCRWNLPDFALLPLALLRLRKADVVVHQKPFKPWFYPLLSRRPRHVFITAYRPGEQFPDRAARTRFFSFFDRILTQSTEFERDLDEVGVPVVVLPYIPPAIQLLPPSAGPANGVLRVGMMGRLEPQKNPLFALEIVKAMGASLPDSVEKIEFNIHGSGTLEAELRAKAAGTGIDTVFHGAYQRPDVPAIIDGNDMFIISSHSEGQCIVALEILAGGRPLFATPVGALPDILNRPERGCLLPADDADRASSDIWTWLSSGRAGREDIQESYLKDYGRDVVRQKYVEQFRELAAP